MDEGPDKRGETPTAASEETRRGRTDLLARSLGEQWVETEPGVYRLVEDLLDRLPPTNPRPDDPS